MGAEYTKDLPMGPVFHILELSQLPDMGGKYSQASEITIYPHRETVYGAMSCKFSSLQIPDCPDWDILCATL